MLLQNAWQPNCCWWRSQRSKPWQPILSSLAYRRDWLLSLQIHSTGLSASAFRLRFLLLWIFGSWFSPELTESSQQIFSRPIFSPKSFTRGQWELGIVHQIVSRWLLRSEALSRTNRFEALGWEYLWFQEVFPSQRMPDLHVSYCRILCSSCWRNVLRHSHWLRYVEVFRTWGEA